MCGGRLNVQKIALTAIVDQTDNFTTRADPRPSQAACAANPVGSLLEADAPPQVTQEGEMIEFLTDMPTNTKIFLIVSVLGLAATLVVLRRLL